MEPTITLTDKPLRRTGPAVMARFRHPARRIVLRRLANLHQGRLRIVDGETRLTFGSPTARFPVTATVTVHDPRFYKKVLFGGSIGAGEAYMAGYWSADSLTDLIRIIVHNEAIMASVDSGWARLTAPIQKIRHFLRRDTRKGARRNISAHYDLGNDFYRLFLDETLTYSAGIFRTPESTLTDAAVEKYDRICRKLDLKPSDHVLEIGTGWGGFAIHAAGRYGCRITTTTISAEQHRLARERIAAAGLSRRVTVLKSDYRDLTGTYDKLVSIEMIEAVGHAFMGDFFRTCSARLADDGLMALQAITIREDRYREQLKSPDFIKRHIFPGSCIPSVGIMMDAVSRHTNLRLAHMEELTPHYARTLREWRRRFFARIETVREMGFSEGFIRMWEFYLCYCEASFMERYIGSAQLLFAKPRRGKPDF